jgi:hypothetical protein
MANPIMISQAISLKQIRVIFRQSQERRFLLNRRSRIKRMKCALRNLLNSIKFVAMVVGMLFVAALASLIICLSSLF